MNKRNEIYESKKGQTNTLIDSDSSTNVISHIFKFVFCWKFPKLLLTKKNQTKNFKDKKSGIKIVQLKTDPNQKKLWHFSSVFLLLVFYHTLTYIHFHLIFLEIHNVSQQTRILKKLWRTKQMWCYFTASFPLCPSFEKKAYFFSPTF